MSFQGQNVVVIGATGVVGSGVVRKYLDAGANVIGVSRSAENLAKLKQQIGIKDSEPFQGVVGDFKDDSSAASVKGAVDAVLKGQPIQHVVSVQGFVEFAKNPTETPLTALRSALDNGLYNNLLAAQSFLPGLKSRDGSSFTLVSGGLAHIPPPMIGVWMGSVKNAAINALQNALTTETANDKVRVNTVCIHFGVAPVGGDKNQFGMPAERDTLGLASAFLGIAKGTHKGNLICLSSWADADKYAA
jgi:NAD(P)-dependent dehydrogenase (short-subunit alcohol dehydrogenase family)